MAEEDRAEGKGKQSADSLRLKIAKKTYIFDVKKKYSVSKNFLLKKKAETPAEDIKEQLLVAFGKKKDTMGEPADKKSEADAAQASKPRQGVPLMKIVFIVVLIILLGSGLFLMSRMMGGPSAKPPAAKPNIFSGDYDFTIASSEILSASQDDNPKRMAYFLVDYASANLTELNFTAKLFSERPSNQVFLLDYERDSADSYPVFRRELISRLQAEGIPINEIGIDRLGLLPSGATVLVPTGLMPKELLGVDNAFGYKDLLARGDNVIYIGYQFDKTAIDKNGMTVGVSHRDVVFSKTNLNSAEGFRLYDPQYLVSPSQTGGLGSAGTIYGAVSIIKYGSGSMMVLPQSLDGGWRGDGLAAAEDIARLIKEERWLRPIAQATYSALPNAREKNTISIFTPEFSASKAFVEFASSASDRDGIRRRVVELFEIRKAQKGEMAPRDLQAIPYYLSGQRTRLNIDLQEDSPQPVKLYIKLYKNGELLQEEELEFGLTNPTIEKPKDMQINAEPGTYVVKVEDNDGRVYAATMLRVIGMEIAFAKKDWKNGKFSFSLAAGGQPVLPKAFSVSMDDKNEKRYYQSSFRLEGSKSVIDYDYPYEMKAGNHTFRFTAGNWTTSLSEDYRQPKQIWDNPLVLILAGLSVLVFVASTILRRPETLKYGLDVPDFPPMSTIKIPVKRQTVLEIFDNVNAGYSWQWMPLRTEELKNGFRRLTYNGKPILIGDFNLERVLAKLQEEGQVREALGYWGLAAWGKESGHTLLYLTIYRILRNVFVNNAVKFSKLDAMKDCDVKAIAGKEEIFFHIMDGEPERVVHRAIATSKNGTTIIVFKSEEERDSFLSSLTSISKLAVGLKMEVNNGNILLLPVKNAVSAHLKTIVK